MSSAERPSTLSTTDFGRNLRPCKLLRFIDKCGVALFGKKEKCYLKKKHNSARVHATNRKTCTARKNKNILYLQDLNIPISALSKKQEFIINFNY